MMTLAEILVAREEIKTLKARYFRHADTKAWDAWRDEVFCPDAVFTFDGMKGEPLRGVEAIIAWVRPRVEGAVTIHHGFMPEITILSETTAEGVWSMEDRIIKPNTPAYHGFGRYHETYERLEAGWRIKTVHLARTHAERARV
ncbi:MAG: nuclear transport factor 2 family protein [Hyphomonadaceae bacterium]